MAADKPRGLRGNIRRLEQQSAASSGRGSVSRSGLLLLRGLRLWSGNLLWGGFLLLSGIQMDV